MPSSNERADVRPIAAASSTSDAALGMIATSLGTIVAIAAVPADVAAPDSLRLPAVFLACGLLAVPIARAFYAPRTLLRTHHVICLGLVYWILLDLISAAYSFEEVSRQAVVDALSAVGLTGFGLWAGLLTRPWRPPSAVMRATHVANLEAKLFWLILLFSMLGIAFFFQRSDYNIILMLQSIGANRWEAPWVRGQLGDWGVFLEHTSYFGYLVPTLCVSLGARRGWSHPTVWLGVILALLVTALLAQGGGRRIVGEVVGSALVSWILSQPRLGVRSIVTASVVGVGLLILMQAMLIYRGIGFGAALADPDNTLISVPDRIRVDDNFIRLAQIIELVPDKHPYVYERQLIYVIVRPVPRVFWPGKPVDPGFDLPTELGMRGVSLSSSMIGEWYLSFGWATVFLGGYFFGRLAAMWNLMFETSRGNAKVILYPFGLLALFVGLRSLQDLVLMSYVVLAWILGTRLMTRNA